MADDLELIGSILLSEKIVQVKKCLHVQQTSRMLIFELSEQFLMKCLAHLIVRREFGNCIKNGMNGS